MRRRKRISNGCLREIREGGGEAFLCEARLIDGLSDEEVRELFDRARDADYAEIAKEARASASRCAPTPRPRRSTISRPGRAPAQASGRVASIDFFGAIGRETAEGMLIGTGGSACTRTSRWRKRRRSIQGRPLADTAGQDMGHAAGRPRRSDRSAWLIRRFIDPEARFKFVSGKGYRPAEGELRFDMFQAEFTHEGDKCTFEVLLDRGALNDPALRAIAEIIHDIDLRDGKFGRDRSRRRSGR